MFDYTKLNLPQYATETPVIIKTQSGREYTYKTNLSLKRGDVVICPDAGSGTFCGMVQKVNVNQYYGIIKTLDRYLFNISLITKHNNYFFEDKAQCLCLEYLSLICDLDRFDPESMSIGYVKLNTVKRHILWNIGHNEKQWLTKRIKQCFYMYFPYGLEFESNIWLEDHAHD